jgi:hypothetical protein
MLRVFKTAKGATMNDNSTLSAHEVYRLAGIDNETLQRWHSQQLVVPAVPGGPGRGNVRRYSIVQAVAVIYAAGWIRSDQVLVPFLRRLADHVTSCSLPELRRLVADGYRVVLSVAGFVQITDDSDLPPEIDLRAILARVEEHVRQRTAPRLRRRVV